MKLGERICMCAACGEHFSATSTFDRHRGWDDERSHYRRRVCLPPAEVGLHRKPNGVWAGAPLTSEQKERLGW